MWLTSKMLAFSLVHACESPTLKSSYCTGIEKPPNGTIFAPCLVCRSKSGVFLGSDGVESALYRRGRVVVGFLISLPEGANPHGRPSELAGVDA